MTPYVIYALPRSRTFWLRHFLTYRDWYCGHDEIRHARAMEDIHSWLALPNTGTVETAAAPFWRLAAACRTVIIRRPVDEVVASMQQSKLDIDWDIYRTIMLRFDRKLDQIAKRVPNVLSLNYDDLNDEATCAKLFEFCLPYKHDHDWWEQLSPINIQCHLGHYLYYTVAFGKQMDKMSKLAKFATVAMMNRGVPSIDQNDGLTIQLEDFHAGLPDALKLAPKHCALIGEPDMHEAINWELLGKLADVGNVQCVTARCNGRMFGYLMTIISPSLEDKALTTATHTSFYADASFKGLGLKLQRYALDALKARGVNVLHLRAGVRGDGPRTGILYKRLGAKPDGEWFKLALDP